MHSLTRRLAMFVLASAGLAAVQAADAGAANNTLIVTASNTTANRLLVFHADGRFVRDIPTRGQGGVSGNAGGIAQSRERLAVVNFGSRNVSIFVKDLQHATLHLEYVLATEGSPVSVSFGHEHLYVLTTTGVESHRADASGVSGSADGIAPLLIGDGSAAQVGVLPTQVIVTEKTGDIETIKLSQSGAVYGSARLVASGLNAPFGLATRGNSAYVTIAHANLVSLVRNNSVLTTVGSGQQVAPCWVALGGPFLFSANTASKSVSRFAVYGQVIALDKQVVAQFSGGPTDIAYAHGLAAVVDAAPTGSHLSVFKVNQDGNFALVKAANIASLVTNGVAVLSPDATDDFSE